MVCMEQAVCGSNLGGTDHGGTGGAGPGRLAMPISLQLDYIDQSDSPQAGHTALWVALLGQNHTILAG